MTVYPWQKQHWHMLSQQLNSGRYPHAILCQGAAGLGKLVFAERLAAKLLCDPQREHACGNCRNCHLLASASHPDCYHLTPAEESKLINVEQVRELSVRLSQMPQFASCQVVIIHPAETMNLAASNALLKTLEEPMGRVMFILVAHQLATIPATVISRCQLLRFSAPADQVAVTWLSQQENITNVDTARLLLQLANYAPLRALAMAHHDYHALRDVLLQQLLALLQQNVIVSEVVAILLKQDIQTVLHIIFSMAFDIFRLALCLPHAVLANQDRIKQLHNITDNVNLTLLAEWLPTCLQVKQCLQTMPGINVQLALESLLLRWQQLTVGVN